MKFSKLILYSLSLLNFLIVAWHALAPAHLLWLLEQQIAGSIMLLVFLGTGTIVICSIDDHNQRRRY